LPPSGLSRFYPTFYELEALLVPLEPGLFSVMGSFVADAFAELN
jgi:hypothetical protein